MNIAISIDSNAALEAILCCLFMLASFGEND